MPNRFDFGGVNLGTGEDSRTERPDSDTPFCIAILGDFSGRSSRGLIEPKNVGERRTYPIDRDNFDEVLAKLNVELHLPTESGGALAFRFSELEDFHPDRLLETAAFQSLRGLREQVQDSTFFSETGPSSGMRPVDARTNESVGIRAPSPARLASGSLLDEMIEQTESRIASRPAEKDDIREFARQVAAKYSVSAPDARQVDAVAAVDSAIGDTLRVILHHHGFQALEALWRATFLLVRRLETGPKLKICLIDVSKEELAVDLMRSNELRDSGAYRQLVEKTSETPGANLYTIIVAALRFGSATQDLELLSRLAAIAHRGRSVLLAEAESSLIGCSSLAETPDPRQWEPQTAQSSWKELRTRPEVASVGLSLPRFLLRLPYGPETSRVEALEFGEFPGAPFHDGYLWGNPAFVVALLLAESFSESGWKMRPGDLAQIEGLPLHTYRADGELQSKACAEVLLTEGAVERMVDEGLVPLVSFKGRDTVRVARFQSIAEPKRPLQGCWNS